MRFFLGVHEPRWLEQTDVPLFVSHRRLRRIRKGLPRARGVWALDSGGFSELSLFGRWVTSPREYVNAVRRYRDEIGGLKWAAIQDHMCEPVIQQKTGCGVAVHQVRTVESYLRLRDLAPEVPWAPVLQGWTHGNYLDCIDLYERAGVNLWRQPIVGVGSVCRRQHSLFASLLFRELAREGLRLHGFGFKTDGLLMVTPALASADSMAWSFHARKEPALPGHTEPGPGRRKGHATCANCLEFALLWRERLLVQVGAEHPRDLDGVLPACLRPPTAPPLPVTGLPLSYLAWQDEQARLYAAREHERLAHAAWSPLAHNRGNVVAMVNA
jgi:hypothetical protein